MEIKEVFFVLDHHNMKEAIEDNRIRTLCMYLAGPHWDKEKNGPLRRPAQLWSIPLLDPDPKENLSTITRLKPGEKPFQNLHGIRNRSKRDRQGS